MPAFLEAFSPVAHLPYLPDVARLELLLRESYHAADHHALPPEAFGDIAPDDLMDRKFALAPSLRLLRSGHPVLGIWRANMGVSDAQPGTTGQDLAVVRRDLDPEPVSLPDGGYAFFTSLRAEETFGAAYDAALAEVPDADLTLILQFAFTNELFTEDTP